jgi:hypothetical protein
MVHHVNFGLSRIASRLPPFYSGSTPPHLYPCPTGKYQPSTTARVAHNLPLTLSAYWAKASC